MRYNFLKQLYDHANPVRAFALNDEKMLVYGTYPNGVTSEFPCFRFYENWTGVEYAAAVLMIQEGMVSDGLRIMQAVRERFDGRKRNPFNEQECGNHYVRAMASWAAVVAWAGFRYSAPQRVLYLGTMNKKSRLFWSTGSGWGVCEQKPGRTASSIGEPRGTTVTLHAMYGQLKIRELRVTKNHKVVGSVILPAPAVVRPGTPLRLVY